MHGTETGTVMTNQKTLSIYENTPVHIQVRYINKKKGQEEQIVKTHKKYDGYPIGDMFYLILTKTNNYYYDNNKPMTYASTIKFVKI